MDLDDFLSIIHSQKMTYQILRIKIFHNIFIYFMLIRTVFVIALVLTLCNAQSFQEYKDRFQKTYESVEKEVIARANYEANRASIERENALNPNFKSSVNQFSDLSPEQIVKAAGVKKIRVPQNQPKVQPQSRVGASGTLPLQVDWRSEGKVSAIKNQGTCGCCWAFTATGLYESFLMIGGMAEPDLSQQFVLECTTAGSPAGYASSCGGGYLDFAIPFIVSSGIPLESAYPYAAGNFGSTAGTPTTAGICAETNKINDTTLAGAYQGNYENLTALQIKEMVSFAPIAVAIFANGTFFQYSSGVYTGCPDYVTSVANVNHAVILVGYDSNGNYIIKNSWGTSWGENGFATISKDNDCGIAYLPREIRGTNSQLLSAFNLFVGFVIMLSLLFI